MTLDKRPKPEKRVTVRVSPELHKAAKIRAAEENTTIADKMRELLTAWVNQDKK